MSIMSPHEVETQVVSLLETVRKFEQLLPANGTYDVPAATARKLFGQLNMAFGIGADLPEWPEQPEDANRWAQVHRQRRHYDRHGHMASVNLTAQDMAPEADFCTDIQSDFCHIQQRIGPWQVKLAGFPYTNAEADVLAALVAFQSEKPVLV